MQERCPNAKFLKRVYLEDYRFVYDGYSSYREGAVANIIQEKGSVVWGALWEIDKYCLKKLDKYEGYPYSYNRKIVSVKDDNGKEYGAIVYYRKGEKEGKPSEKYRETILEGAKECNLPMDYIEKFILQEEIKK
ncbi:MAG: gamma-glutamylcyclotransferase [Candidatus Omnitrophica bacterium]|nr:gamma-glutamylcyclotransferase [Candidatus Omnitrophota bacterium]